MCLDAVLERGLSALFQVLLVFCLFVLLLLFVSLIPFNTALSATTVSFQEENTINPVFCLFFFLDHTIRSDSQFISDATLMTEEHREEIKFNESYGQEVERQKSWREET